MSTSPNAGGPHDGPFQRGHGYRVKKTFAALRDSFTEGEVLIFQDSAYSRYDSITGYFFRQTGKEGLRVWDVDDDAEDGLWRQFFEEIPADSSLQRE
ncbi:hypothetical protein [Prosthecobacter sp.]|uniref:hypothetical protein n=1 Tax=Prosthecobacter sp. TaxID=1965333 RepID=UPI003783DCF7